PIRPDTASNHDQTIVFGFSAIFKTVLGQRWQCHFIFSYVNTVVILSAGTRGYRGQFSISSAITISTGTSGLIDRPVCPNHLSATSGELTENRGEFRRIGTR